MRRFILALSLIGMASASAIAQPPPPPEIVLAPPPGTELPPPPRPTAGDAGDDHSGDPERAKIMIFDHLFALMDTDGDGRISKAEMLAWLKGVHFFGHGPMGGVSDGPMGGVSDGPMGGVSEGEEESCGSTDTPATPVDCTVTGSGWQEVSNVLSEENCQLGYTDAVTGPNRRVIYDNNYSVACVGGSYEPSVYVGLTPSASNWGAFVQPSKTCQMKTGTLPSDPSTRVVEQIVCPAP